MGGRRRARNPMALPMHLEAAEAARYDAALSTIEARGPDALRAEATLVRQQLALHASYVNACEKIERFSDELRESGARLVPLRFPIRLTQKTRACVEDGVFRSFLRFLQDLHGAVLAQHVGGVGDAVTTWRPSSRGWPTRSRSRAAACWTGSCRTARRATCASRTSEKCQIDVVRREAVALLALGKACDVLVGLPPPVRAGGCEDRQAGRAGAHARLPQDGGAQGPVRGRAPAADRADSCARCWRSTRSGCTAIRWTTSAPSARHQLLARTHLRAGASGSWGSSRRIAWLGGGERGQPVLVRPRARDGRRRGRARARAGAHALLRGRGARAHRARAAGGALTRAT